MFVLVHSSLADYTHNSPGHKAESHVITKYFAFQFDTQETPSRKKLCCFTVEMGSKGVTLLSCIILAFAYKDISRQISRLSIG